MRDVAKWLVGALAAVATVMLAGSQLSTIGSLSLTEDSTRLTVAAGSAAVAVLGTVLGIYAMSRVLTTVTSTTMALREDKAVNRLTKIIAGDPGFLEGRKSVSALLADYTQSQEDAIAALQILSTARNQADLAGKKDVNARTKLDRAEVGARHANTQRDLLGRRVRALVELDGYLKVQQTFRRACALLAFLAIVIATSLIVFAWAANPPKPKDDSTDEASATALEIKTTQRCDDLASPDLS